MKENENRTEKQTRKRQRKVFGGKDRPRELNQEWCYLTVHLSWTLVSLSSGFGSLFGTVSCSTPSFIDPSTF